MAQSELTQPEYENLKSDLGNLSDNKAAAKHHVGKRRVAMVRRSKSYAGYLQIRRNEARKAAQSRPAQPTPGTSELPNENQEFLAQTTDGQSLPADKVAPTHDGGIDLRTDEEKAAAEAAKADRAKQAEAERANRAYARRERFYGIVTLVVIALAIIGIVALAIWIISLF